MSEKIYEMKLHDVIQIDGFDITRVGGGWLYENKESMVFVPFNSEFDIKCKKVIKETL